MRIALPFVLLFVVIVPLHADRLPQLRGATGRETRVIEDLLDRSAIARDLVAAIEGTDVIVYVQLAASEPSGSAATRFVTAAGPHRFLRIVIGTMTAPGDRAVLLAHELQHVVEIAREPGVRDDEGMQELYGRIGEDRRARTSFETTEAREVSHRVRRELAAGTGTSLAGASARVRRPGETGDRPLDQLDKPVPSGPVMPECDCL